MPRAGGPAPAGQAAARPASALSPNKVLVLAHLRHAGQSTPGQIAEAERQRPQSLTRTFTDRHGLKDLCKELLGVDLSKQQQTSDWGAVELTAEQLAYAASDVLHLHALWAKLEALLVREGRRELAEACFGFLPARARLDLLGYEQPDIFAH